MGVYLRDISVFKELYSTLLAMLWTEAAIPKFLFEATIFFSPPDLKMVPGRGCRRKLMNSIQKSVSVQLTVHKCDADVQIIFMSHKCALDKQQLKCEV